ncbi:MAG: cytochrome b/b6 domain-containing protein [Gammaproteobacteria bacterium]|nr:cytochrome b/b6 domain-containing protein [Gammaproteobacteria bacterium]
MKPQQTIKVWDPFVRIFHWGLVLAFTVAYLTEEDILSIHTLAGYVVLGLLSLRLVWGLIGPRYARFSDFTYSLSSIKTFLKDTLNFRARRYLGHNPAGGAMILLLIASLLLTSFTGLAIYALAEQAGPLAGILTNSSEFMEEALEETHEFFANFTLFLVFIHIAGVIIESLLHRENLARSMVTGYKRVLDINEEKHS